MTTDVGLSPPFNSLFTFFGQFFDHGVDQTVKGSGTVMVPFNDDDPLVTVGADGIPGNGDEVPAGIAFIPLSRGQIQAGPDGILGDGDDVQDANNTDSPWVDQSQTYTSHAAHQVFLREYALDGGRPVCHWQVARRHRQRRHDHRPWLLDGSTTEHVLQRWQRHHWQHLDVGGDQAASCTEVGPAVARTRM